MTNGRIQTKTVEANNIIMNTSDVSYDFKYNTPNKLICSIDLSMVTEKDEFYNVQLKPNSKISKIELLTNNLSFLEKSPIITLNLNDEKLIEFDLDSIHGNVFMFDSKKVESMTLKLNKLSLGMVYIVYDQHLMAEVSNTELVRS